MSLNIENLRVSLQKKKILHKLCIVLQYLLFLLSHPISSFFCPAITSSPDIYS